MSDLIKREDAIEALQKEINKGIPPFDDTMGAIRCGVRLARNIIEDLPSADRPQGEWRDSDGNFVPLDKDGCTTASAWCSNCGEWLTASDEYWTNGRFCPMCGARMRGDKDD